MDSAPLWRGYGKEGKLAAEGAERDKLGVRVLANRLELDRARLIKRPLDQISCRPVLQLIRQRESVFEPMLR